MNKKENIFRVKNCTDLINFYLKMIVKQLM